MAFVSRFFQQDSSPNAEEELPFGLEVSILLLGIEHSGKTTFFKQIQSKFTSKEFQSFLRSKGRSRALRTLIRNTQTILKEARPHLRRRKTKQAADYLNKRWLWDAHNSLVNKFKVVGEKTVAAINILWKDKRFLKYYANSKFLQSEDTDFVFKCLDLAQSEEEFSEDISEELHLRLDHPTDDSNRTAFRMEYSVNDQNYKSIYIPEKRGQCEVSITDINVSRKSLWKPIMKNINVVLYFCSLADYCTTSITEPKENLLRMSLRKFSKICEGIKRKDTNVYVVLSKVDMFIFRLTQMQIPLSQADIFEDCPSGDEAFDPETNISFIKRLFLDEASSERIVIEPQNIFFMVLNVLDKSSSATFLQNCVEHLQENAPKLNGKIRAYLKDVDQNSIQESSSLWERFMGFFTSMTRSAVPEELNKENLLFYKVGAYVVLRLNEAVSSIFKAHPFRSRGSIFIFALASTFIAFFKEVLGWPGIHKTSFDSSISSEDFDPGDLFSRTKQAQILEVGPDLRRTDSIQSNATIQSFKSAISLFASCVKETKEYSISSSTTSGRDDRIACSTNDADDLATEANFLNIMNEVLINNGYVENLSDPKKTVQNLISILKQIRTEAGRTADLPWKKHLVKDTPMQKRQLLLNPKTALPSNPALYVEAILGILHKVNKDICHSNKNHFQHSRLVADLKRTKNKTRPNLELFAGWIKSRNELDNELRPELHPISILGAHLNLPFNIITPEDYNNAEKQGLQEYLVRKMNENP